MSPIHDESFYSSLITFSCYHRLWLFKGEPYYMKFLHSLRSARDTYGFKLYAYVVMPNHVHMIILPNPDTKLQSILHTIKRTSSFHCLNLMREQFPDIIPHLTVAQGKRTSVRFWQAGGGHQRIIRSREAMEQYINYIHGNPGRAELVDLPEEWPWSSASSIMTGKPGIVPVDPL